MKASVVMFDFFGTLVDYDARTTGTTRNAPLGFARRAGLTISTAAVDAAWQQAWTELEASASLSGREFTLLEVVGRFREALGISSTAGPADSELATDYLATWTERVVAATGLHECLTELAREHRLAVVSNTHDPGLVPSLLERLGISSFFEHVVTSVETGWRKPQAEIFMAALSRMDVPADEAVFVGDNWECDVVGPLAVGMTAVYLDAAGTRTSSRVPVVSTLAEVRALLTGH